MITKRKQIGIDVAYFKTMCFFFPVVIYLVYFVSFKEPRYIYSSVLNKSINKEKEAQFKDLSTYNYYSPNYDEY